MKTILFFFLLNLGFLSAAQSQTLLGARPGKLTIYGARQDGTELMAYSDKLSIAYDNLKMVGSLPLGSIMAEDESLSQVLAEIVQETLSFEGIIPEGHFAFGNSVNEKFTVETDLILGDIRSSIIINFDVSNVKTNTSNTFIINCNGDISLTVDLGVTDLRGLQDKIRFMFTQNVQSKKM